MAIVGAGAAGLMAAAWAGRAVPGRGGLRLLDGARVPGAKILVSGGGRCNVTHATVDERAFDGSSRPAIRKVLRRFDVPEVRAFFAERGVALVEEATGKLFPSTHRARTVLDALLDAAADAGARPERFRVEAIAREGDVFALRGPQGEARARRVILAAGGASLPRTGSDGAGFRLAASLGHSLTRTFPALVPLTLPSGHPLLALSGLTLPVRVEVRSGSGRRLAAFEDSALVTHFGLSGPAVLDASRHWQAARHDDAEARLLLSWLPSTDEAELDAALRSAGGATVAGALARRVPDRLARVLCELAGVEPSTPVATLARDARRAVVRATLQLEAPVTGTRGWNFAEVTAGGVPLDEIRLETMESRACPGLHLCGEVCDVDGRIGGYNFQWAWASGFVAGRSASLAEA